MTSNYQSIQSWVATANKVELPIRGAANDRAGVPMFDGRNDFADTLCADGSRSLRGFPVSPPQSPLTIAPHNRLGQSSRSIVYRSVVDRRSQQQGGAIISIDTDIMNIFKQRIDHIT